MLNSSQEAHHQPTSWSNSRRCPIQQGDAARSSTIQHITFTQHQAHLKSATRAAWHQTAWPPPRPSWTPGCGTALQDAPRAHGRPPSFSCRKTAVGVPVEYTQPLTLRPSQTGVQSNT
jgi:hypothetical protein